MFGDFANGYLTCQRSPSLSAQRLNELYVAEGKIGLLFKLRVGGDIIRRPRSRSTSCKATT